MIVFRKQELPHVMNYSMMKISLIQILYCHELGLPEERNCQKNECNMLEDMIRDDLVGIYLPAENHTIQS